ncbi:hypothetical protein CC79DRAFT_1372620 [Sarocladium strictum]
MLRFHLLSWAAVASSAVVDLGPRQETLVCETRRFPDINACDGFANEFWGSDLGATNTFPEGSECVTFFVPDRSKNCVLAACRLGQTTPEYSNQVAWDNYNLIRDACIIQRDAGGLRNEPGTALQFQAFADPQFNPPTKSRSRKREDNGDGKSEAVAKGVSREELEALIKAADKLGDEQLEKRQDDQTVVIESVFQSVPHPDHREEILGERSGGSSFAITESQSFTAGVSVSTGIDAKLWEIFTASISTTVSLDFTVSNTVGETVTVGCEPTVMGILFWEPLFIEYVGHFEPSGQTFDNWIPIAGSRGRYVTQCLG